MTDEQADNQITAVTADAPRDHYISDYDIIKCVGVNKWYGEYHALRDINMGVKEREVVVVIGPSGSGKSTLIRCMNRLEEHQEGQIIVDGMELSHDLQATSPRFGKRNWHGVPAV